MILHLAYLQQRDEMFYAMIIVFSLKCCRQRTSGASVHFLPVNTMDLPFSVLVHILARIWRPSKTFDIFPKVNSCRYRNAPAEKHIAYSLGAVHKWRQHFLGCLTPLGAYVSLSSAFGLPLGASNWWRHLWTALNQKWSSLESSLYTIDDNWKRPFSPKEVQSSLVRPT